MYKHLSLAVAALRAPLTIGFLKGRYTNIWNEYIRICLSTPINTVSNSQLFKWYLSSSITGFSVGFV